MKLVMTLVVRDEADIVGAQLAYHLNAGVDLVLATDHDSQDGTVEILESYARQGALHLTRERGEMRESDWRSRMARAAATEHGADWILNTDADEFWMSRRGRLKEALAAVPERFGIVWALTRHFVPRPDDGASFSERMTARFSGTAPTRASSSSSAPTTSAPGCGPSVAGTRPTSSTSRSARPSSGSARASGGRAATSRSASTSGRSTRAPAAGAPTSTGRCSSTTRRSRAVSRRDRSSSTPGSARRSGRRAAYGRARRRRTTGRAQPRKAPPSTRRTS